MTQRSFLRSAALAATLAVVLPAGSWADNIYDFSFGFYTYGSFTTGAPSGDPGFYLIGQLWYSHVELVEGEITSLRPTGGIGFSNGAAYNPSTGDFINHLGGTTTYNIGDFSSLAFVNHDIGYLTTFGSSFEKFSDRLSTRVYDAETQRTYFDVVLGGSLIIKRNDTIPEPSSLALACTGCLFAVIANYGLRRAKRKRLFANSRG